MPIEIEVRLTGAMEIARALPRLEKAIRTGSVRSVGRPLSAAALRIVRQLTPRQIHTQRSTVSHTKRGFDPFWTQWALTEQLIQGVAYIALVRNKAAKEGPTSAGFRALAAVEFGARPHDIVSTKKHGLLVWDQASSFRYFLHRTSPDVSFTGRRGPGDDNIVDRFDRQSMSAGVVRTRLAHHPGHHSFRMVQETRRVLVRMADTMLRQFQVQIKAQFDSMRVRVR